MDFKRFQKIIEINKKYEDEVESVVSEFNEHVNINGDIFKLMKEIGEQLDVFVIEIPLKYSEFGAVFLDLGYSKYLLLNSNQPRCKMYFSFCHDIYHVLRGATNYLNESREVHLNSDYLYDENECRANLFSANLLMPKIQFKKMYELYVGKGFNLDDTVLKLMNYFNSPFVAVVIRLFELRLIDSMEGIIDLLNLDDEAVKEKFNNLGISNEILKPTLNDEMNYIFKVIEKQGKELISSGLLDENRYSQIVCRLKNFYKEIKIND